MSLYGESSAGKFSAGHVGNIYIFRFGVIGYDLAVDLCNNMLISDDNLLRIPLVVICVLLECILGAIKSAGFLLIRMS